MDLVTLPVLGRHDLDMLGLAGPLSMVGIALVVQQLGDMLVGQLRILTMIMALVMGRLWLMLLIGLDGLPLSPGDPDFPCLELDRLIFTLIV